MASVFTMIINGELPGHFVWRDDRAVAFLSINPLTSGHTLVVPIEEADHWLDLPVALNQHLTEVAQHIGQAQQHLFEPERIGLIVAGFEVPHVHVHVMPINGMQDMDLTNVPPEVDHQELAHVAGQLRSALAEAGHEAATAGT